jgi:hypothetical protein
MSEQNRPCAECAKYDRDGVCSDIGIRITEPGTELPCPKFVERAPAPERPEPGADPYREALTRTAVENGPDLHPGAASPPEREPEGALSRYMADGRETLEFIAARLSQDQYAALHNALEAGRIAESRALAAERDLSSLRAGVARLVERLDRAACIHIENAEEWRSRSTVEQPFATQVVERETAARTCHANATALRALLGAGDAGTTSKEG